MTKKTNYRAMDNLPMGGSVGDIASDFVSLFSSSIIEKLFTLPEVIDEKSTTHASNAIAAGDSGPDRNRPARRLRSLRGRQSASSV
jgi:hypothetical protein